jgi:DNA polymerase-3 subunit gamma/tau
MMMRKKIYIMDECHRFSTEAWEALLKTIEEPPEHLMFILATTNDDKIPETIKTRCMCLDFKQLQPKDISAYLGVICQAEQVKADQEALDLIASCCDGGLRRALSYLEAVVAQGSVTSDGAKSLLGMTSSKSIREFLKSVADNSFADGMKISSECLSSGVSVDDFLIGVVEQIYYVIMLKTKGFDPSYISAADQAGAKELFDKFSAVISDTTETGKPTKIYFMEAIKSLQECHRMTVFKVHPQHWVNYSWLTLRRAFSKAKGG